MIENGQNYLITTDGWFQSPDGDEYRAVWGKAKIITTKESMGFNPSRSTNWFVQVGEGEGSIIVAGCQIHYAIRCPDKPVIKTGRWTTPEGNSVPVNRIYVADNGN